MSEKLHPTKIGEIEADEELGRQLMRLRFDKLQLVLKGMSHEAHEQAMKDLDRERFRLGTLLARTSAVLDETRGFVNSIVQVCKKHIEAEKQSAN